MQEYRLKFGLFIYDEGILEIIINSDVEVTTSVDERSTAIDWLKTKLK